MNISGFQKEYMIYMIKCNITHKIYIGSTSNLTTRVSVHLSSFKQGVSTCRSVLVLKNGNYKSPLAHYMKINNYAFDKNVKIGFKCHQKLKK